MNDLAIVQRITRDITDGLLLVDLSGEVVYINPQGRELLGNPELKEGMKYAEFMAMDDSEKNDEFHQYVLDSVYDKKKTHVGAIKYICPDGDERYFRMTSSYLLSENGEEQFGIILQFADVTKIHNMKVKYEDAVKVLVALVAVVSVWNIIVAVWAYMEKPVAPETMTVIIEVIGVLGTLFALKFTSITVQDFGLGKGPDLKKSFLTDAGLTLILLVLMVVAKLIVQAVRPDIIPPGTPFFHWNKWTMACTLYPLTVFAQELLTRGAVQGCLCMVLPEGVPVIVPIVISSVFFGALHIHKGLFFMLGAMVLLSVFGLIYNKQKTIWGLCIPHYFLGLAMTLIWGA